MGIGIRCLHTIYFCCSSLILYAFQNTGSKLRHSAWSMFFWLRRSSERHDMWWWSSRQNIRINRCIKTAYRKQIVSNIPVLVSACFTRPIYHSQYSYSQELFVRFMAMGCRKCYTIENISNILRQMKVNGVDFILRWYSGGIFFQNTSPVEKMRIILYWRGIQVSHIFGSRQKSTVESALSLIRGWVKWIL